MSYAKSYSIKRAVLEPVEHNNMYDLNRQLIDEDKNIIVIKQSNIVESIQKFENVKGSVTYKQLDLSSFLS